MSERIDESSGWPIVNLVEQLEQIIDNRGKTPIKADSGIPSLSAKSVKMGMIEYEKVYFVSQETYDKFMVRGLPKVGDVLLTTEAPLGCVARLDRNDVCLAQRLITLRGKEGVLDNDYLRLYLSSSLGQHELISRASGSTVQGIKRTEFSKIDIVLPPFKKQLEIAKVIRAIEEKIEVNHQTNQTLEQIAQAIFKSWFVDFEPTRAKIIAKEQGANLATQELAAQAIICGAITLEQLAEVEQNLETTLQQAIDEKLNQHKQTNPTALNAQQLKTTAALFPNELVESELGDVPEGWAISSVGEHVKVTKGRSYKSVELEESDTALVTLKSFMRGGGYREDGLKAYTGAYKPEQVVEPGELVMSLTDVTQAAEIIGKPAIVTKNNDFKTLVASLDVSILRPRKKEMKEYFYGLMSTYRFHRYAESFATGTTVLHLNTKGITSFEFALPDFELCRVFSKMVLPMLAVQQSNIHLSRTLEELRDSLLPKLLSGELDVSALADNSQAGA